MRKVLFENYQLSGMETQKWHFPDHSIESIQKTKESVYLHGALYEIAHTIFETMHRRTLKR